MEGRARINSGVVPLSCYRRDQPLLICGPGRSGTTAMARCFLVSEHVRFVTDAIGDRSALEIAGMFPKNVREDPQRLARFRESVSRDYATDFVFKSPAMESELYSSTDVRAAWQGANLLIMSRCPVATALREFTVNPQYAALQTQLHEAAIRAKSSITIAGVLSETMGVVCVSYEKLLSSPEEVFLTLNEWFGKEVIPRRCASVVEVNCVAYRDSQGKHPGVLLDSDTRGV